MRKNRELHRIVSAFSRSRSRTACRCCNIRRLSCVYLRSHGRWLLYERHQKTDQPVIPWSTRQKMYVIVNWANILTPPNFSIIWYIPPKHVFRVTQIYVDVPCMYLKIVDRHLSMRAALTAVQKYVFLLSTAPHARSNSYIAGFRTKWWTPLKMTEW